jgi:hypothetical protein
VHGSLVLHGRAAVHFFLAVNGFILLGCSWDGPSLCMVESFVSLHDWLALSLHG